MSFQDKKVHKEIVKLIHMN